MDEELLKKILGAAGVNITPEQLKSASEAFAKNNSDSAATPATPSPSQPVPDDAIKTGLTNPGVKDVELRAFADMEAARRSQAADRPIRTSSRRPNDPNDAKFKREVYKELGLTVPDNDNSRARFGAPPENRLDALKERNQAAQAEASRRDGIRDSNALDISGNLAAGKNPFADDSGAVVGPDQLQKELIAGGMDRNDANIAAGQRYRDMFDLPNAKSEGWGMRGGQRDAVLNAKPEDRMEVMENLRTARADNLKSLTEQRLSDPARRGKSVGMITSIESHDGRVLAKRGEGESVVARGGTQGAMGGLEDRPGALTLTQAGENVIRDRLTVQETSAPTDKPLSGSRVVTGRYGTAIGGTSVLGQMKNDGAVPQNFKTKSITEKATVEAIARPPLQSAGELTTREVTRTVGQAPLPKEYAEGRDKILAEAGQTARAQGEVVGDAKPLLDRMAPGTGRAIDQKYDRIAADLKQQQSDKLGNDFLNAYKASGGKVNAPKPGAESPGPRTDQDKAAMQAFLKDEELKRRLAAQRGRGV